ncbi:hypothetical protein VNI00_012747 [Paramarasmius palmivorus]|uniref:Uncharacterized protein n=1 Tax=Paramarasmius palmivorus TaxID=297713 RepID=A0AAW0C4Y6_9AGAR
MSSASRRRLVCRKCGSPVHGQACGLCGSTLTTLSVMTQTRQRQWLRNYSSSSKPHGMEGLEDWKGSPPVQTVYHDHEEYTWTSSTGGFSKMVVQYSGAKNATGWNDADFEKPGFFSICQLVTIVVVVAVLVATATAFTVIDRQSREQ